MPLAIPVVSVPEEPPPPQAVASEETAPSTAAVVASDGEVSTPSSGSGDSNTDSGDITVAHRVQPLYADASVRAGEQGYVVAGLLIDEHGLVRKVHVVKSTGFRRLDQSVVDALRLWTFKRTDAAPSGPTWAQFTYGFHSDVQVGRFNFNNVGASALRSGIGRAAPRRGSPGCRSSACRITDWTSTQPIRSPPRILSSQTSLSGNCMRSPRKAARRIG